MEPLLFPTNRQPDRRPPQPRPDLYAAILGRLAALGDEIEQISELVVTLAVETARERDG